MGKIIKTHQDKIIMRVSRWIKIRQAYNPRGDLKYYAEEVGDCSVADYFLWNGKRWPIGRFIMFGSMWTPEVYTWVEGGVLRGIAGFDSGGYLEPIMIEIDPSGERVRVYKSC